MDSACSSIRLGHPRLRPCPNLFDVTDHLHTSVQTFTFDHNRHCFPTAWYLDAPPKVPCPCLTLALGFDHTFPDITPSGYHITTPESSTLSIYQTIRISKACQGHTIGIYQYRFITTYSYMTTRNTKYARCSQSKSLHPSRILID